MSNSQEPSYYEIALTNRQVLGFFVVLLVAVVAAFFSGVWLGQERGSDGPALAQVAGGAATVEDSGDLEELNFFTDSDSQERIPEAQPASPQTELRTSHPERVPAVGRPDTTLVEDVADDDADVPPERPEERVALIPPRPEPEPEVSTGTPAAGAMVVQVFASDDGVKARDMLDRLTAAGYQAFLSSARIRGTMMHRVRIGPFEERGQAEAVARQVGKAYRVEPFITTNE